MWQKAYTKSQRKCRNEAPFGVERVSPRCIAGLVRCIGIGLSAICLEEGRSSDCNDTLADGLGDMNIEVCRQVLDL